MIFINLQCSLLTLCCLKPKLTLTYLCRPSLCSPITHLNILVSCNLICENTSDHRLRDMFYLFCSLVKVLSICSTPPPPPFLYQPLSYSFSLSNRPTFTLHSHAVWLYFPELSRHTESSTLPDRKNE